MDNALHVMHGPFSISLHAATFVNYLEVVILPDGHVEYAVPSHTEKLLQIAMEQTQLSREQIYNSCPPDYYFSVNEWLCKYTNCVAVNTYSYIGEPNDAQLSMLRRLAKAGLFKGSVIEVAD